MSEDRDMYPNRDGEPEGGPPAGAAGPGEEIVTRGEDVIDREPEIVTRGEDVIDRGHDTVTRGEDVIDRSRDTETRGIDVIDHGPKNG